VFERVVAQVAGAIGESLPVFAQSAIVSAQFVKVPGRGER
jgi:hypothetical protein